MGNSQTSSDNSVGIVEQQKVTLFDSGTPLALDCGQSLVAVDVAFETYGTLNS